MRRTFFVSLNAVVRHYCCKFLAPVLLVVQRPERSFRGQIGARIERFPGASTWAARPRLIRVKNRLVRLGHARTRTKPYRDGPSGKSHASAKIPMDMKTDEYAKHAAKTPVSTFEANKERATAWFESLRDSMLAVLEAIEDGAEGAPGCEGKESGRFTRSPWEREEGGGGVMSLMGAAYSRRLAVTPRPSTANSPKSSPDRSQAPPKTRAFGPQACPSSPTR